MARLGSITSQAEALAITQSLLSYFENYRGKVTDAALEQRALNLLRSLVPNMQPEHEEFIRNRLAISWDVPLQEGIFHTMQVALEDGVRDFYLRAALECLCTVLETAGLLSEEELLEVDRELYSIRVYRLDNPMPSS